MNIRSVQVALVTLASVVSAGRALAAERVIIAYTEPSLQVVAERLASELASDDQTVELRLVSEPSPCDSPTSTFDHAAWVQLTLAPEPSGTVVADLCLQAPVQRTASRGSITQPERFALVTAEALNGLRAPVLPPPAREVPAALAPPRPERANRLALMQTTLMDPDLPVLWGIGFDAELAITSMLHVTFDGFVPISSMKLAGDDVRVQARTTWLRAGFSAGFVAHGARFSGALVAGPVLTWASAEADAPRIGAADSKPGAVTTLAATIEYPRQSRVFLVGAARVSAVFPAVRIAVGADTSHTLGPLLSELSLGVGVGL